MPVDLPEMNQYIMTQDLLASGKLVIINGGIHVKNESKTFNNTISGNQGSAFSFGDNSINNVTNNYNNDLVDITKELLGALKTIEMNPEEKQELEEVINTASEEANSEKPKKAILKSLLISANTIIDTLSKTPALITAYDKWHHFIQGFIS